MAKKILKVLFWWVFLNWMPYNISESMVHMSRRIAGERGNEKYKDYNLDVEWVWCKTIRNLKECWKLLMVEK